MSEQSKWQNPPELTAEEKVLEEMKAMSPRDSVIALAMMSLSLLQFGEPRPEKGVFLDFLTHILQGVKHTAEMDIMDFIAQNVVKECKDVADARNFMLEGAALAKQASYKSLDQAKRLLELMEPSRFGGQGK